MSCSGQASELVAGSRASCTTGREQHRICTAGLEQHCVWYVPPQKSVHCWSCALWHHHTARLLPCFSEKKERKNEQAQRAQYMPRFEYSSRLATAGVHTPQSNDSMRRTGSPSSRSKVADRCRRGVEALVTPQSKTRNTFAPARAQ